MEKTIHDGAYDAPEIELFELTSSSALCLESGNIEEHSIVDPWTA